MSVLVILLPPRARLAARAADGAAPAGDELAYVLSQDGLQISRQGRAQPSLLPRADSVALLLADSDLSWHRITCPKAPGSKLRAALGGLLEEQLLEDDDALHLALAPGARPGEPVWVAALHKPWLRAALDKLEAAGLAVERVLPPNWPGDTAQGHFFEAADGAGDSSRIMLCHADESGLRLLRLQGSLARALLPQAEGQATQWSAEPAVAATAERWLGSSVRVWTEAERALQAARSLWNLRQFDLAPRHRGLRALRDALRQGLSPAWRPARIGLIALLLLQLAGLNAWAWQQRRALADARQAQEQLLRTTFPTVRAVLDAPVQMQRETEALRAAAGRAGANDLEALLGAAAAAWPEGQGPAQALRFEPGKLTLTAPGWSEPQLAQFRERLRPGGWLVEGGDGQLSLSRNPAPGASS
ncbi:MAG TPA: type II secretion system protein GspL [Rubrivivax sp.]|nr:type II secretion system protein GspL [Rubrivivax sp.]